MTTSWGKNVSVTPYKFAFSMVLTFGMYVAELFSSINMENTSTKSGDVNQHFGIYKSSCCGLEIVLVKGGVFPLCHKHKLPASWKLVTEIEPPPPPKGKAA